MEECAVASVWTWFVLGALIFFGLPTLALTLAVTWPFDRGRYLTGRLFRQIAVLTVTLNPLWRFRWTGAVPADPRHPYVVVSNHESFSDILLLSHLPWEMKWLSKAEIMRIPFLGWCMQLGLIGAEFKNLSPYLMRLASRPALLRSLAD